MARSRDRRDDRYVRDRDNRRRSRSRDRERREDYRPRRSSPNRADERYSAHRSRDYDRRHRKRSRSWSRSPVRDNRRERDGHRYSDDRDGYYDRDRKRVRHDEASPRRHRGDDNRDRGSTRDARKERSDIAQGDAAPGKQNAVDAAAEEERKKRERQAKVELWKAKIAAKNQAAGKSADTSRVASPSVGSPAPSAVAAESPATQEDSKPASPAQYAGKFDPKAIAKKAKEKMDKQKNALGGDVIINRSATVALAAPAVNGAKPEPSNGEAPSSNNTGNRLNNDLGTAKAPLATKITGFGLNKISGDETKHTSTSKPAAGLEDDEVVERKLEKLPDMPEAELAADNMPVNEDEDDVDEIQDDEAEAAAARDAAEKRAQEAQDVGTAAPDDVMDVQAATANDPAEEMEVDEDIDPLDAFMQGLEPETTTGPKRGKKAAAQVFNSDDEDQLDAVGTSADDLLAAAAKRKKKELPVVDHEKANYEPFRKNFYSEPIELAGLTEEEVDIMRADLDNITIYGKDAPKPITKFSQGGFGAQILDVIRDLKYEKPSSIQSQALPAIMSGRDVIGVAKTGSGKTMAFILPMFRHIKDQRSLENLEGPVGLILAPTRELAVQIHRDCKPFLKALNLRAVCAYGGAPIKDQIAELKRGAEIVVCTPGRMIDLLAANSGRVVNLRRVTYVVLDEADRMFDMGFEPQISKILNNIRPNRQTVLFSATFPRNMEALAKKATHKALSIIVGGRSVVAPEITQEVEIRAEKTKFTRLLELLGNLYANDEDVRSLIFVERQETADSMLKELRNRGYPALSVHGGREQIDRDQAIDDFKAGHIPILIATSVAARGLDVKQLKLVVNFDSPNHKEDYVHRAGRTGRAGNTGTAVTFVTPEQDRFAPFLCKALEESGQAVPEELAKLKESYDTKVKSGEAKKIGSGFGGRGIERLDAAREAERALEKGRFKTADEGEEEETEEAKAEKDKKTNKVDELVAKAASGTRALADQKAEEDKQNAAKASDFVPQNLADHLNNAMKVQKVESAAPTTSKSGSSGGKGNPLDKVAAAVAGINARLGARGAARPGAPVDNRGPDAGAFHATLEINDFPQKARWAVTNRTNVAKILEATGTSITSKGNYYPAGKEPESGGMPKLYILVEGDTEVVVENAMRELTRLLREGTIAAMETEGRATTTGRYSVV